MSATNKKDTVKTPIVRMYRIGRIKYVVSATVKAGAVENATAKVRRLIKNEIKDMTE